MSLFGQQYPLYYPQYISGHEKGENNYYESDDYDGNGTVFTKGIVIFGATGDLCKKKLIPALYKLWQKEFCQKTF